MPLFSSDSSKDPSPQWRQDEDDEAESAPPVDEHTRLLPNRLNSTRDVLRPDDPAVSPYNLWTVRILRYVTIILTLITFTWWVLLLVSTVATPPGFNVRGSGFYAYGYSSLALANMLFTIIFFGVPARPVRILVVVIAVSSTPALVCV